MNVLAIVPAAGRGARLGKGLVKPLVLIHKKPLLAITLGVLQKSPLIDEIIVACPVGYIDRIELDIIVKYKISKVKECIEGGATRQESVYKALLFVQNRNCKLILIHDGARPFLTQDIIGNTCTLAMRFGACVAGVPVKDTVKRINLGYVRETLDRTTLWQIQTPQVFKKDLILSAYKNFFGKANFSDDASLVERLNRRIRITEGSYYNIKITTPEDLVLAQKIYEVIDKR